MGVYLVMHSIKRKLLFTHEDVLPHEVGMGSSSFTHLHNRSSELQQNKDEEAVNITSEDDTSSPILERLAATEHDLTLVDNVEQLRINDNPLAVNNSSDINKLRVVVAHGQDDRSTVSNGVTFNIPVTSSTKPTSYLVPVANPGNCTSVFIDVVEWLSPLIIGQLDGKVTKQPSYCAVPICPIR